MRVVTLILIPILCLQIDGYLIKVPTTTTYDRVATTSGGWIHIQKLLLPLFENVCEESTEPIVVRLNEEFKLDPSNGVYLKPDVINNLQNLKATKGLLTKGEIFIEYNPDHLYELKIIYELLYYARDFETFYKAACWARQNVNCGLFVDAIYMAIINRRDTEKVSIPAPYEILPNYFIKKGFMIKASSLMRGEAVMLSDCVQNEGNAYILNINHTTSCYDENDDKLAYFHEDIGLNSYYFLTKLINSPWTNDTKITNFGLYLYHVMKQMASRYNLERYSNGLPELQGIDWDYTNDLPYDSKLIYSNGNEFRQRTAANIGASEVLSTLKTIEDNLPAVVVHMRDSGYNKSDILNHLIEILVTSERSYMTLALQFLSEDGLVSRSPSVLEHYMTSVRDPIFWKLNQKIVDLVDKALQNLPSYSRNQLYFPGVEIKTIEVKNMMTSFDKFQFDVTNALKTEGEVSKFEVKIDQTRLNHKPFAFKINVLSLIAQKSLVKIYIGPKVTPGEIIEKKNLFMLLDSYEVNLKVGNNLLTRASADMTNISGDFLSLPTIHKVVLDAEFGVSVLPLKSTTSQIGFPSRLILPKGTSEGLPFYVFVFVAPYVKATIGGARTNMELNTEAILSPGYPLDLNVAIQELFNLPNAMVKEITITHKSESTFYNKPAFNYNSKTNGRIWPTGDVESDISSGPLSLSGRPDFTKKSFDYKSKRGQYGRKFDYTAKRNNNNYQIKKTEEINMDPEDDKFKKNIEPEKMEVVNNIYINPDLEHDTIKDNDDGNLYHVINLDKNEKISPKTENDGIENIMVVKNHKINEQAETGTMDFIDNIYMNHNLQNDAESILDDSKNKRIIFLLDKDEFDDILLNTKSDKLENDDLEKDFVTVNKNIKPHRLLKMPGKTFSNNFNIYFKPLKVNTNAQIDKE